MNFMNRTILFLLARRGAHRSRLNDGCNEPKGSPRPDGFTLMELLIVMAIIAILMLIAIPTVTSLKKNANRLSAIQSVRAIQQAQMQYESTYPANGYACQLSALGGDPSAGAPSPTAAQILQADITSGYKSGYIVAIGNCTKVTVNGTDRITSYTVTAVPQTVGKTGDSGFCSTEGGAIKSDPTGGTNCTQLVQ
jgi:type IV pilus assembly protein PilA